ncbi:tRNA (adenine(58)-N(1))-methyltransferase catalytic subunit trmt61a [Sparganum proliferum]
MCCRPNVKALSNRFLFWVHQAVHRFILNAVILSRRRPSFPFRCTILGSSYGIAIFHDSQSSMQLSRKRPFRKTIASEGDTVIVSFGKNDTMIVKLLRDDTTQLKFGALKHNDVIGKPYGSRIKTSRGHVHVLALDPTIWSASLPHRTQIIYPTDASMIVGRLDLVPGSRVMEAGTGSGALTHALAQAVWPTGCVRTFDFHQERVNRAKMEFEEHEIADIVQVEQLDVLTEGFPTVGSPYNPDGVHAVMIDFPEPWVVIPRLSDCFSTSGGRICIFSPCIEQVQKSCDALRSSNFTDVEVMECVQRTYDFVHTVLNVPNLGQCDAQSLLNGTYVYKRTKTEPTEVSTDGDRVEDEKKPKPSFDRHLLPPPPKYVTSTRNAAQDEKSKSSQHADGSWEAYPKVSVFPFLKH